MINSEKAGLENLDKIALNEKIKELSKNSLFYRNQLEKEEKAKEKITALKEKKNMIHPREYAFAQKSVSVFLEKWEAERDLSKTFLHLDMDAFYAAVEMRDNPSLLNVPLGVGGDSMLCTANYEARKFGVTSAMPGYIARVQSSYSLEVMS